MNQISLKQALTFFCFVFFSASLFSQDSKLAIGIQGAPSLTSFRGNTMLSSVKSDFVISYGLTVDYKMSSSLSVNSGVIYDPKRAKSEIDITDQNGNTAGSGYHYINQSYITIPLMVNYTTGGNSSFYIGGGTYFSFLLNANDFSVDHTDKTLWEQDNAKYTKKLDIGLAVNTGFNFKMSENLLFDLGIRNLLAIFDTSSVEVIDNGAIKTNALSVILGIKYSI